MGAGDAEPSSPRTGLPLPASTFTIRRESDAPAATDPADRAGLPSTLNSENCLPSQRRIRGYEDREPPGERLPDIATQSVADGQPQPVSCF
jgi:hypothetical protein